MFGYVTPLKEELTFREYDIFKSYYCGLCQHIKKQFGHIPRLTLSYDITTMAILLDSIGTGATLVKKQSCITSIKKRPIVQENTALKYCANINVILSYYKLQDDVLDENSIKSKLLAQQLKPYLKKASPEFSFLLPIIKSNLNSLRNLEKSHNFSSIDEIADPFANLVGMLFKKYPNNNNNINLYDFGYVLGKWIYLIDALDDLEKDTVNATFNPLNILQDSDIEFSILSCGATCKEQLNSFRLKSNTNLLNNIILYGMMDKYTMIKRRGKK
ncbi:MAG: hypothetical protein BEN19_05715 [Epulopiscium sp. Nuni2H_MBin003]|nr:MAG: hypothetical protein BEN19_05715 [Epulopiscium sp. Nuni2H_MBin003]